MAKVAGLGMGTVARYNKVMKSGNENTKKKVLSGEVKIGTAYREVVSKMVVFTHENRENAVK